MKYLRNLNLSLEQDGTPRTLIRKVRQYSKLQLAMLAARMARRQSKSTFIGITGSSAKSTTSSLLAHVLEGHGNVSPMEPFNMLPSVIKSASAGKGSIDYVVSEVGVSDKGDMPPMAGILKPNIAIVTLVGLEHHKSFRSKQGVAAEKVGLVEEIQPGGLAVLNADDDLVMGMANHTKERVVTFGRNREADFRVVSVSSAYPEPLKVEIVWHGGSTSISSRLLGEQFWLSIVATFATAIELGVSVDTIKERCASFAPLNNRCQPFPTTDGPVFILDTFKAPWESIPLAWRVIEQAKAPRKRIVLGQLADYAGASRPKYRNSYAAAREIVDQVIFFGDNAHRSGASEEDRENGLFCELRTVKDVHKHIKETCSKDEVILLKSSKNTHLERAALAWKYDVKCWVDKCGVKVDCLTCGLYEHPFEEHDAIRLRNKTTMREARRRRILDRLTPFKK